VDPDSSASGAANSTAADEPAVAHGPRSRAAFAALALGALGVVFGDIGTSPLYAMRETFASPHHTIPLDEANVFGVLSLVTWALIIVISVKYLAFVMRADNGGEGGILALTALIGHKRDGVHNLRWVLVLVGLFGTALLYGDGMITPAISVLSAVEGSRLAAPALDDYIVPIAVVILVGLFAVQPRGTGKIGRIFGPIMVVWFTVLAVLGIGHIVGHPGILGALNPIHALRFFHDNGLQGLLALGAVVLVVTGGEALYADMGHFGKSPIRAAWFVMVFPALLLNYFGQGALLLSDPGAIENPFYRLVPDWGLYPLLLLATVATVIASQALISGAFSLTMQAVQLGYSPRVKITHTSEREAGQIYVGAINWLLMIACIGLVIGFKSSTNLASAYGLAVTATMAITSVLFFIVARERLGISTLVAALVCGAFLLVDLAFLLANIPKIPDGGWFPLVIAAVVFTVLTTWATGRHLVARRIGRDRAPLAEYAKAVQDDTGLDRVEGTAVYLFSTAGLTPPALRLNVRHNRVLHEHVVVLAIVTAGVSHVAPDERVVIEDHHGGIWQIVGRFGYLDEQNVPELLADAAVQALGIVDLAHVTYVLGRETVRVTDREGMVIWREHLFAFMARNATPAANYFSLPTHQVIELGVRVDL
jgi:KUP system potassium uptake protein